MAGEVRSFEGWQASNPVITFRSLDEDTAEFTITGDVTTACPVDYGDAIRIFRQTDSNTPVCWFVGTASAITARGSMRISEWAIRCSNFWFKYSQLMFQQTTTCYNDVCSKITTTKTTKVVLFQDARTGWALSTGEQIRDIVNFATSQGLAVDLGTRPAFVNPPFEVARDLTVADAIRRCMQFTPDGVSWVDYSSGAPVLNFQKRLLLSSVTLDAAATPRVISQLELRKRNDLVPSGVRFNYITFVHCPAKIPELCVDDTDGTTNTTGAVATASESDQLTKVIQDSAGAPDAVGGIIGTFDLAQMTGSASEGDPTGLALDYYASLTTAQWEGEVIITELECTGSIRPGKILNISNGNADWAAMNALVQQVHENLENGETTITLGPPGHLSPTDFISLLQMTRRRPLTQNAYAATRAPGPEDTNCYGGKDPTAQQMLNNMLANGAAAASSINNTQNGDNFLGAALHGITLAVCQDGSATTITVYGPP